MTELKRCPFCGGEATLVEDIYNDQLCNYVICSNDDCNANTGRCDTKDEALAKWNTRPNPWHTGTPTEEGWYVCKLAKSDLYETHYYTGNNWSGFFKKWQKIEPYKASKETD